MSTIPTKSEEHPTRIKILDAALDVLRERGYEATRVEHLCERAGVTKGAFFHHFKGKEDLAIAAAAHWSAVTGGLFETAPYHQPEDPLDKLLAYVDFREMLLQGGTAEFSCVAGTMAQETHLTHPAIRDATRAAIFDHAKTLEGYAAAAKEKYCPDADWGPESLALYTQAALQGAFILAKADSDVAIARDMIGHLRRYIELLFGQAGRKVPAPQG